MSEHSATLLNYWKENKLSFPAEMLNGKTTDLPTNNLKNMILEPTGEMFRWNSLSDSKGKCIDAHSGETIPLNPWLFDGDPNRLISVEIRNTSHCQHKCAWCYNRNKLNKEKLSKEALCRLVESAGNMQVQIARFLGGGEVLTDHSAVGIIEKFHNKSIPVSLITNGGLLGKHWRKYRSIIKNIKYIRVSIDAASARTHARQHGCSENDFPKIIKTLDSIASAEGSCLPVLGTTFLINQDSLDEVVESAVLFKKIGINTALYRAENNFTGWREESDQLILILKALQNLQNLRSEAFVATGIEFLLKTFDSAYYQKAPKCYATRNKTTILPNGDVLFCPNRQLIIGNINKQSLEEIWGSDLRKKYLAEKCSKSFCFEHRFNRIIDFLRNDNSVYKRNIEYFYPGR